ncbi:hypothetical protein [Streptomyces sp. NPDC001661]
MDPRSGPRPLTGTRVTLFADDSLLTATGRATVTGVTTDGRGYAQLVLDDADPDQHRTLATAKTVQTTLYRDDRRIYESPCLTIGRVWRTENTGAVTLLAKP